MTVDLELILDYRRQSISSMCGDAFMLQHGNDLPLSYMYLT